MTARLIKVLDGSSIWAGTFDEKFTDVFALQDAISEKVVAALSLRLNQDEHKRLTKRYTENVAAYQLYLTGRYHWSNLSPPELQKSIEFFKKAIEADPGYALAYYGLAESLRASSINSDMPPNEVMPLATSAARKAIELIPLSLSRTLRFPLSISFTIGIGPRPRRKRRAQSRSIQTLPGPTWPTPIISPTSAATRKRLRRGAREN